MGLNKYMDCRDIDSKTFKYHTFQFLHILKKNGIYCRKYWIADSNRFKNTLNSSKRKAEELEEILNYFNDDDLKMIKTALEKLKQF